MTMNEQEFIDAITPAVPEVARLLDDGREVRLVPLTFGRARITISLAGAGWYFDGW